MAVAIEKTVDQVVRKTVEANGYDLILVEFNPKGGILRLYIDHPKGVGIDDCTKVSHWVSDLLDAEGITDRIDINFNLEVSSPGLDRPLARPQDFQRFVGSQARVTTREAVEGRRRFIGELKEAHDTTFCIDVDGTPQTLTYQNVQKARLVPEYSNPGA